MPSQFFFGFRVPAAGSGVGVKVDAESADMNVNRFEFWMDKEAKRLTIGGITDERTPPALSCFHKSDLHFDFADAVVG